MPATGWNVDVPPAEYYGPLPHPKWADKIFPGDVHALVREIEACPEVAIDTETTGLVIWKDYPLYFSLAWGNRRATLPACLLPLFARAFSDPRKTWILANAKYDMHILANAGFILMGRTVDICVEHALLFEDHPHGLKQVSMQLLGWKWRDFQDTFGKITAQFPPAAQMQIAEDKNFPLLVEYAANDAWGTLCCHRELKKMLMDAATHSLFRDKSPYIETLWDLFDKIEVPYTRVLWKNERNGILVDLDALQSSKPVAEAEIRGLEGQIAQMVGGIFNPKSPLQLRELFINTYGVPALKMSKGGKTGVRQASVDSTFLEHYADLEITGYEANVDGLRKARDMAALLVKHRKVTKLYGTYIVGLSGLVDHGGRIHTRFNQDVARCMPAGELVLTSRGYLPVEEVTPGDSVITHKGRKRRVTEVSKHAPSTIYTATLKSGLKLRTNGEHPYLIGDVWVPAHSVRPGMLATVHSGKEEWRPTLGGSGYLVSSWGRVKGISKSNFLRPSKKNKWGHLKVRINGLDCPVHSLVIQAFRGLPKVGEEVRHLNGIAWDNTLSNLAYGTAKQNRTEPAASFSTSEIVSVLVEGSEETYGLTVEEDHSHVTGGVVTHNTGRLSSADPNLQNIPNAEKDTWKLRKSFIARPGCKLVVADYEQLEMRLLACAAMEKSMIDIFLQGRDIHMGNATIVFGIPYEDMVVAKATDKAVKQGQQPETAMTDYINTCMLKRRSVKSVGFGLNYGMGSQKMASDIGVPQKEAEAIIEQYLDTYPAVAKFYADAIAETERTGYSFTLLGRRRNIPEIMSNRRDERSKGERQAVNTQIQGTAADVVKMAQIRLDSCKLDEQYGCQALLNVHDELIHELPESDTECKGIIKDWMEHPFVEDLAVPLTVSIEEGSNWQDCH